MWVTGQHGGIHSILGGLTQHSS
ncbi:hypothetical protein Godav_025309 [Gossypium davidsonii]|uniref:Uncharacterized protein n=2 Tax=Gossypium TaxID=3633 RepID=A0A7J8PET2_GOSRA|nr:hypothetical protein [Gossypium raimondii]MBA0637407.1 hypothetical protein [Gossypium davidsonii]